MPPGITRSPYDAGKDAGSRLPGAAAPVDPPVMPAAAAEEVTAFLDEGFGPEPG
jgi:hypothetical protein